MRSRGLLAIAAAGVLLMPLSGCGKKKEKQEIVIPILETQSMEYRTVKAEISDISEKYYQKGSYAYPYSQAVKFKASGRIKSVEVVSPCDVKAGDLLCTLYDDDVVEKLEQEEIRLDQMKNTVETLRLNGASQKEYEMAQIDLQLEQMRYDRLERSLEDYKVYAPCDGEFVMVSTDWNNPMNVNSPVRSGQLLGYTSDKSEEYLCVSVYDSPLSNVNFGTSVRLDQGAKSSTGTVIDVVFNENGDYSTYTYVIQPDNEDELFDFGDINVVFDIYSRLDTVVIPKKAVKELSGRKFVYLLVDGVKIEQDIETGIEDNDMIEVTSGLVGGEDIILN